MVKLCKKCSIWPPLFFLQFSDHGRDRISDRYGKENHCAVLVLNLLLPGTPNVYFGEELGMSNADIKFEELQDMRAKNNLVRTLKLHTATSPTQSILSNRDSELSRHHMTCKGHGGSPRTSIKAPLFFAQCSVVGVWLVYVSSTA